MSIGQAIADQYPITGAWAVLDKSSSLEPQQICSSYKKDSKQVTGNLIVFQGSKKTEYNGGYLEEETVINISVLPTGQNQFQIVDRLYQDEEWPAPGFVDT